MRAPYCLSAKGRRVLVATIRRNRPWTRSTGPRSAEGKRRSAANSLRHGQRQASVIHLRGNQAAVLDALHAHIDFDETTPQQPRTAFKALRRIARAAEQAVRHGDLDEFARPVLDCLRPLIDMGPDARVGWGTMTSPSIRPNARTPTGACTIPVPVKYIRPTPESWSLRRFRFGLCRTTRPSKCINLTPARSSRSQKRVSEMLGVARSTLEAWLGHNGQKAKAPQRLDARVVIPKSERPKIAAMAKIGKDATSNRRRV